MATCPPIPLYNDDPFIYYARYLISSFRNVYGTGRHLHDDQTVFEYSAGKYDSLKPPWIEDTIDSEYEYMGDLSSVEAGVVSSAIDWTSALPLYIKLSLIHICRCRRLLT